MGDSSTYLSLQHDWKEGFKHSEKVWVSAHSLSQPSVQSYLKTSGPTDNEWSMAQPNPHTLSITHKTTNTSAVFLAPSVEYKPSPKCNPVCVDVTSTVSLGASPSGKDVMIWEVSNGIVRRLLVGHLADVTCTKFFPSNLVLLTGSEDMCVKIWSIEDGSCPVTLTGHKRAITQLQIVEKGRNVVSSSLDGTIKLWNCGTGACINTIQCNSEVNDIALLTTSTYSGPEGEGQVLTSDKLILSACESGVLYVHSLCDGTLLRQYRHTSPLSTVTSVSDNVVITGSTSGEVITLDLTNISEPLSITKRSNSSVLCVRYNAGRLWVSHKDGACYTAGVELCGGNCEAVYDVVCKEGWVFTSCRDRCVRGYKIGNADTTSPLSNILDSV